MDLSPASLFFGLLFGAIGFAAFQIGRKRADARKIVLGIALMGLTFVAGGDWWAWLLAAGMTGLLFWP